MVVITKPGRSHHRQGVTSNKANKPYLMKIKTILPLALAALAVQIQAEDKTVLKDQKDKAGYSIGANIGSDLKQGAVDVNIDALVAGLKDSFTGAAPQLTESEQREVLAAFQKQMTEKMLAERMAAGEKAKKEGEEFLAANKAKEGIKSLPSGLQYKVLSEGKGAQPKPTDEVTVNYRGTLVDGTEFDSSYKRGEPATFPINGVIKGWSEALPLMKAGAKWQLFVPATLAYGERGAGREIPPNATLIFEVELVGVKS
jgi:FKBP-type peptidyl-prolyl cis-trans isomerase FklB